MFKYSCLHSPHTPPIPTSHTQSYPTALLLSLSMCPTYMFPDHPASFPPFYSLPLPLWLLSVCSLCQCLWLCYVAWLLCCLDFKFTFKIKSITLKKSIWLGHFCFPLKKTSGKNALSLFLTKIFKCQLYSYMPSLSYSVSHSAWAWTYSQIHVTLKPKLHFYSWIVVISTWAGKVLLTSPKCIKYLTFSQFQGIIIIHKFIII